MTTLRHTLTRRGRYGGTDVGHHRFIVDYGVGFIVQHWLSDKEWQEIGSPDQITLTVEAAAPEAHDDLQAAVEALRDVYQHRHRDLRQLELSTTDVLTDLAALLATPAPEAATKGEHTITLTTEPTLNSVETMAVVVLTDGSEVRMRNLGDRAEIRTWDKTKSCNPPDLLVDPLAGRHVIDVRPAPDLPTTVQADRDAGEVRLTEAERNQITNDWLSVDATVEAIEDVLAARLRMAHREIERLGAIALSARLTDQAMVHGRWHRALDDITTEPDGPIKDHLIAHRRRVQVEALREAAEDLFAIETDDFHKMHPRTVVGWLRARADRIQADE